MRAGAAPSTAHALPCTSCAFPRHSRARLPPAFFLCVAAVLGPPCDRDGTQECASSEWATCKERLAAVGANR